MGTQLTAGAAVGGACLQTLASHYESGLVMFASRLVFSGNCLSIDTVCPHVVPRWRTCFAGTGALVCTCKAIA